MNEKNNDLSLNERTRRQYKKWASYYRRNIHRFCKDFMGLNLKTFQKMNIFQMDRVNEFMYIAARGQSKSFLIAVFCVARCILYPNTQVILSSGTKKQAKLIITEKIQKELMRNARVANEILDIKANGGDIVVYFKNGSTITAVTSNDNARGYRANIVIYEEARMIKEDVIQTVLKKFLNWKRKPPFMEKEEYQDYPEEVGKQIYISSAWYKNHWMYQKFKSYTEQMLEAHRKGKKHNVFAVTLPWHLSYKEKLLPKDQIIGEFTDSNFNPFSFDMEMNGKFVGEKDNAFFTLQMLDSRRILEEAFYPFTTLEYLDEFMKTKTRRLPKVNKEIRLIGRVIALMGGKNNDYTVFTLYRLLPNGTFYKREVPYMETMHGEHSEKQAIRLKQLFHDFDADYVVMDTNGNGMSVYENCVRILHDGERGIEYPAWCAMNNEAMASRAQSLDARPVIYSMKVVKAELNHDLAMSLRDTFTKNKIKLLKHEQIAKEYLEDEYGYSKKERSEQLHLMHPYYQTSNLISEMINLEYKTINGFVKLEETGNGRKDRYSSLAYVNYYAKLLEQELNVGDDWSNFNANDIVRLL